MIRRLLLALGLLAAVAGCTNPAPAATSAPVVSNSPAASSSPSEASPSGSDMTSPSPSPS